MPHGDKNPLIPNVSINGVTANLKPADAYTKNPVSTNYRQYSNIMLYNPEGIFHKVLIS